MDRIKGALKTKYPADTMRQGSNHCSRAKLSVAILVVSLVTYFSLAFFGIL